MNRCAWAGAVGAMLAVVGCREAPAAKVEMSATCKAALDDDYVCQVANLSDQNVRACWLLRIQCTDGATDEGNACEDLGPHGSATHRMVTGDLRHTLSCREFRSVGVPQMLAVAR